jgi:hypothetical protein
MKTEYRIWPWLVLLSLIFSCYQAHEADVEECGVDLEVCRDRLAACRGYCMETGDLLWLMDGMEGEERSE